MDKQNVIYPYNGILIRCKKKQITDIEDNEDKPQKHYSSKRSQTQKTIHI